MVLIAWVPGHCLSFTLKLAVWPRFGRELLIRFTVCSFCILTICNFSYFPDVSGFEGGTLVPIASVPGHCLSFSLSNVSMCRFLCGMSVLDTTCEGFKICRMVYYCLARS